ncbi:MAG: membrane protein insertase YidC [Pseudomonadales bacterium]|nr:membrane protein insertase YidC [Pseudomonadales bacterium]
MDLTKFFLYTSLAVITYLMLLAWQEDYPPLVDDGSQGSVQLQIPETTNTPVTDVPTDVPSDVPSTAPSTTVSEPAQTSNPSISAEGTSRLINIETDTLVLSIDLNGGDIVQLALPLYLKQIDVTDDPFVLLESNQGRSYVAQSGLIGANGTDSAGRAAYRSSASSYRMADNDDSLVVDLVAESTALGVTVTKRFTFNRDSYLVDVSFIVENQSAETWQANAFGQIKRDSFDDPSSAGGFGRTFLGFVTTSADDPYIKIEFDDIDDASQTVEMNGGWVGFSQHYFLSAWIPAVDSPNRFTSRKNDINQYFGEFTSAAFAVAPGTTGDHTIQFYAGPKDQYSLAEMSPNLDLTIDYGFLWFLAAPIYWLLTRIDSAIGNYGISIILLTIVVKAFFYKLSESQYKSMAGMRRLMPKMQQLKDRYGDDKIGLQKATMDLYKKEKINPFGGCLPMLVQMPVFIALYWVLMESVELRHAPFIGWLTDLSVRDPFFILPLLMGATMFLQTKLSPAPADPMQARVMQIMPIMMTVLFLWFPAGLVLYWLTNGMLGILQQWYITRKIEAAYEAAKS